MFENLLPILILLAALGSALMAGMFFTFSNFVMKALAQLDTPNGIAAMQRINVVIINPLFFIIFMGTALLSIGFLVSLVWRDALANENYLIAANLFYLLGVMGVTMTRNVPMNNALEAVDASSEAASQLWNRYLVDWIRWNHVRSVASFLATLCFILALMSL